MKERWKPEKGERYWLVHPNPKNFVDWYFWNGDDIDERNFANRNCFRTESEAQAAAEKVKVLLLSLHEQATDCNQLPKLTAEVFNRPDCPEWAKYAAADKDGRAWYFEAKPSCLVDSFFEIKKRATMLPGFFCSDDWQNSLIERSAKLPDWCKEGSWIYYPKNNWRYLYLKVTKVYKVSVKAESSDGSEEFEIFNPSIAEKAYPARLRPYNAEELKIMVGKNFERFPGVYLATAYMYEAAGSRIAVSGKFISADKLMQDFTINGAPAGVLEHLENGEWVK